jgi:hypothetical protein
VSTTERLSVANPEELRQQAKACLQRAQSTKNSTDQLLFLSMAGAWHALAGQVEKIRTLSDQAASDASLVPAAAQPAKADA